MLLVKINWFKLNRALHRDIGYLVAGITIIFAISGIAVNHRDQWNSNYRIEYSQKPIQSIEIKSSQEEIIAEVKNAFQIDANIISSHWHSQKVLKLFFENNSIVSIEFNLNKMTLETTRPRFLLKNFNKLHLNESNKLWTLISDIYAIALSYLSISSLFMVKGQKGISGRGAILFGIGLLIPLYFLI